MIRFCDAHHGAVIPEGDETCLFCQREGIMTQPAGPAPRPCRCGAPPGQRHHNPSGHNRPTPAAQ